MDLTGGRYPVDADGQEVDVGASSDAENDHDVVSLASRADREIGQRERAETEMNAIGDSSNDDEEAAPPAKGTEANPVDVDNPGDWHSSYFKLKDPDPRQHG